MRPQAADVFPPPRPTRLCHRLAVLSASCSLGCGNPRLSWGACKCHHPVRTALPETAPPFFDSKGLCAFPTAPVPAACGVTWSFQGQP